MRPVVVIIVFIGILPAVLTQKELQIKYQQTCRPVRALIFWHLNMIKYIFDVQRHLISRIINNTREGTNIRLDVIDTKVRNVLSMKKDNTNDWIESITKVKRGSSEQNIIPYKSLVGTISNFTNETVSVATELFFVVNDKSKLDDDEIAIKELKRFKTYVVFYGEKTPPKFWTNLATDKHRLLELNDNFTKFLNLTCQDSKLQCDTNRYWTGKECRTYTFICSKTYTEASPYCVQKCPYFRHRDNRRDQPENVGCNSLVPHDKLIYVFSVSVLILMSQLLR
ncbi:uncharacterized protein LOC128552174 [Mercenaria mercenaria]|uniref:uncharacterized protein LOC128552174 n=1 Tax=Mercenaria mercenaria TaxID=6596 RepID=UPI00234F9001|nr:uncharacterized protein LOC128552174 [Mercenaria mercenaria]